MLLIQLKMSTFVRHKRIHRSVKMTEKLTIFGEVVDDCVSLTVAVKVSQLRAAVNSHIVDTKAPLTAAAGVQDRALQGHKTHRCSSKPSDFHCTTETQRPNAVW